MSRTISNDHRSPSISTDAFSGHSDLRNVLRRLDIARCSVTSFHLHFTSNRRMIPRFHSHHMPYAQMLLPEFDHEMANTRKVLQRVPEDKLDWKPHTRSHTIGWNANHLTD